MTSAGIILCGGKSSRMGYAKAWLPFGPELLLQRVVRLLGEVVQPVVVVAAQGQALPELPSGLIIAYDQQPSRGPLEGLRTGLATLGDRARFVYATSCDVPLLKPALVRRLLELAEAGSWQAVVPEAEGYRHPLSAVYATTVLAEIDALLAADQLRPTLLTHRVPTLVVAAESLREVDPELSTLRNLNHPADYLAALAEAGYQPPSEVLAQLTYEGNAPHS